jgi:hypothetical protein
MHASNKNNTKYEKNYETYTEIKTNNIKRFVCSILTNFFNEFLLHIHMANLFLLFIG